MIQKLPGSLTRSAPCSISNFTPKVGEKDTQRAIRQAFTVWQTVTPLSFQVRASPAALLPSGFCFLLASNLPFPL